MFWLHGLSGAGLLVPFGESSIIRDRILSLSKAIRWLVPASSKMIFASLMSACTNCCWCIRLSCIRAPSNWCTVVGIAPCGIQEYLRIESLLFSANMSVQSIPKDWIRSRFVLYSGHTCQRACTHTLLLLATAVSEWSLKGVGEKGRSWWTPYRHK